MTNLYPLKFNPILKERVWGGYKIIEKYKDQADLISNKPIGESWVLSGLIGDESIVSEGFLADNNINDLIETYLGEIVGDSIYEKYGNELPILFKILDINKPLSLQVHPDDIIALERHNSYGKSECWYVLDCEKDAIIYLGLKQDLSAQEFYDRCNDNSIIEYLNVIKPKPGDLIYIKPGTLHSAQGGLMIAEIQQPSDITYRVYDWGREHNPNTAREMHLDLAIDCIDLEATDPTNYIIKEDRFSNNYFEINIITIDEKTTINSPILTSMQVYFCLDGYVTITSPNYSTTLNKGETILIPSQVQDLRIIGNAKLIEFLPK